MSAPLTSDQILDAAESVLRRFGPAKASVVDVARALGVSHGSVYRHFPSKAALRDAVLDRWLASVTAPLSAVAAEDGPATERLRRWLDLLIAGKQGSARDDPELFATYQAITADSRDVAVAHVAGMIGQLTAIVADGAERGEFEVADPAATGRAVFHATARFHSPRFASEWSADTGAAFEAVWDLIMNGLFERK